MCQGMDAAVAVVPSLAMAMDANVSKLLSATGWPLGWRVRKGVPQKRHSTVAGPRLCRRPELGAPVPCSGRKPGLCSVSLSAPLGVRAGSTVQCTEALDQEECFEQC